jgi:hypothetical protein
VEQEAIESPGAAFDGAGGRMTMRYKCADLLVVVENT